MSERDANLESVRAAVGSIALAGAQQAGVLEWFGQDFGTAMAKRIAELDALAAAAPRSPSVAEFEAKLPDLARWLGDLAAQLEELPEVLGDLVAIAKGIADEFPRRG